MRCGPQMMRQGYLAMRNGSWEKFKERCRKEETSSETLQRIREGYEKAAKDEIGRFADAAQDKQEGKQGQWQQEFGEVLEQVKGNADTDSSPQTMRRAYIAMEYGN